jgi:hypothetical protein
VLGSSFLFFSSLFVVLYGNMLLTLYYFWVVLLGTPCAS